MGPAELGHVYMTRILSRARNAQLLRPQEYFDCRRVSDLEAGTGCSPFRLLGWKGISIPREPSCAVPRCGWLCFVGECTKVHTRLHRRPLLM